MFVQVIYARDLSPSLRTFGWSISGGLDVDNNKYPDILVGAYESGHAVHMRSAPVVHMDAAISYADNAQLIELDRTDCTLADRRTWVPCIEVLVSLTYSGEGVPDSLEFDLHYLLDSKKVKNKRMYFLDDEKSSSRTDRIQMLKGRIFNRSFKVFIPGPHIKDKLTPLDIQFKYSLVESAYSAVRGGLRPVLGNDANAEVATINIAKDCDNNICVPDLSIKTKE